MYVGEALRAVPETYVVLVPPAEYDSLFSRDKDEDSRPSDAVVTLRVWGTLATCTDTSALATEALLHGDALADALEAQGRRLLSRTLVQSLPVPSPPVRAASAPTAQPVGSGGSAPTGGESAYHGRQIAVRISTQPLPAFVPA